MAINLDNINPDDVAKSIIDEKIEEGKSFSLKKLKEEINHQGGTNRISLNNTIEQYLTLLTNIEVINYNPFSGEYTILKPERD